MNYRFNLDDWLRRFPLHPAHGRFSGKIITGPGEICNNEHLRVEAADQFDWGAAVPVDIFIMAEGEPNDRHVTKIGGLPYRPAEHKWPTGRQGTAMTFLAQIDFTDSSDIVGELPGDVLLVFTESEGDEGSVEPLHFEWQTLGIKSLISQPNLPEQPWKFDPFHGYVVRTVSYPNAKRSIASAQSKYPICRGMEIWSAKHLLQYQATQIGEAPYFIQQDDRDLPGRMLCAISSIDPHPHTMYPWLNRQEPLTHEEQFSSGDTYFKFGDVGCIYISIDDDGQLHYTDSCY